MAYDAPKQAHELDVVSLTITGNSLIPCQDVSGNRLGVVRPPDIVKNATLDDIQDGATNKKFTATEKDSLSNHLTNVTNPHTVTKTQVGLGNVDNTSDLNKPISTATQTALDLKSETTHDHVVYADHVSDYTNPHTVTPDQIGLGNVDNTRDVDKPISTATQTALDTHIGAGGTEHADVIAGGASGFMTGADKTKLNGVATNANNYVHPSTHPATIIVEDSENRFVSDTEKSTWNAKQDALPVPSIDNEGMAIISDGTDFIFGKSGGGLSWYVYTTSQIADPGNGYLMNVSAGALTVTVPAVLEAGDSFGVADLTGDCSSVNTITILRNGHNIHGIAEDLVLDIANQRVVLAYSNVTEGLVITDMEPSNSSFEYMPYATMHIQCQKPSGTSLSNTIIGTQIRELTTTVLNDITGASRSGNQFTLPPGTYSIKCYCPLGNNSNGKLFLYSVTKSANKLLGMNSPGDTLELTGTFTIVETEVFEIREYSSNAEAMGSAASQGTEIYLDLVVTKIGGNYAPKPVISAARLSPIPNLRVEGGVIGFDMTSMTGNTLTYGKGTCLDEATLTIPLAFTTDMTITLPSTVNGDFFVFAVRRIDNGLCEPRAYSTLAGPASDTAIDAFHLIDYAKNDGAGVTMPYRQVAGRIDWLSTFPQLTGAITTSYVSYSLAAILPVTLLLDISLAFPATALTSVFVSYNGTNMAKTAYCSVSAGAKPEVTIAAVSAVYLKAEATGSSAEVNAITLRR